MKTTEQIIENEATLQVMAALQFQRDEDKRIALRLRADDIRTGAVELTPGCLDALRHAVATELDKESEKYL